MIPIPVHVGQPAIYQQWHQQCEPSRLWSKLLFKWHVGTREPLPEQVRSATTWASHPGSTLPPSLALPFPTCDLERVTPHRNCVFSTMGIQVATLPCCCAESSNICGGIHLVHMPCHSISVDMLTKQELDKCLPWWHQATTIWSPFNNFAEPWILLSSLCWSSRTW